MTLPRLHPEADAQRQIVAALRAVLPPRSIVHHSANEQRGSDPAARRAQAIAQGMGVHAGFSDLVVLTSGRVIFLEVKSATGRPSGAQLEFRDEVTAQGHIWALVRSPADALEVLALHGVPTRIRGFA